MPKFKLLIVPPNKVNKIGSMLRPPQSGADVYFDALKYTTRVYIRDISRKYHMFEDVFIARRYYHIRKVRSCFLRLRLCMFLTIRLNVSEITCVVTVFLTQSHINTMGSWLTIYPNYCHSIEGQA